MVKVRKFAEDKKGISPLFISLYLALIVILLISMLFFAVEVSSSGLNSRLKVEQERMQERIVLVGPEALELTDASVVERVRVDNVGSITVRIRALYIGHEFICDPSEFEGDAYVEPKESLWINLSSVTPAIIFNDKTANAYWTMTTERGSKASEIGGKLKWGEPEIPYTANKFYFGPLMLVFDMFHWRSGSGPWTSGWSVPKGTKDVTWRILCVNIDNRDIVLTDTCCLTLISNDNSPKDPLPWYIDPTFPYQTMALKPGVFNFIHYTWSKPFSAGGTKRQAVTGMQDLTTCITFLTFFGQFIEVNNTLTPFGQTIPFEAVLVTSE
ncbi:MAG: hypothetical protein OEZ21_02045 [Candidatus Bathyarchaeota archaeon]|nr:hypothetical protein [Candidatus Bathyarchaeota archaeon]MDH5745728.1 hypothetical protein [Candidatus Bathyarchaeota archaeon]